MSQVVELGLVLLFLGVHEDLQEIIEDLDTFLDFSLDEVQDSLSEILVELETLGVEVAINCSLEVEVSFVEVFVVESELGYLEKSISSIDLSVRIMIFDDLFKM
jgi:hypothetical protein